MKTGLENFICPNCNSKNYNCLNTAIKMSPPMTNYTLRCLQCNNILDVIVEEWVLNRPMIVDIQIKESNGILK